MSWLNPAALIGLLALAVPILVHWFGRPTARRTRFPSLRLLRDVRAAPATPSRPTDILLLVLRCGVIAAAVLGLAQPLWSNPQRARVTQGPARVIIVDTSASMNRLTSDRATGGVHARALGQRMLDSAREGFVVETGRPGASVAGAGSWLRPRSGVRELVVISDFQAGALHESQLASVPPGIGVRLEKIPVVAASSGSTTGEVPDTLVGSVRLDVQANRTDATWIASADTALDVGVLASAEDTRMVGASVAAVRTIAPRVSASRRKVAVVFPRYAARRELAAGVGALNTSWQGDLLMAVARDRILASAAGPASATRSCERGGVAVAHNAAGEVIATMSGASADGAHDAVIFSCVEAGSIAGTALLAAVVAAVEPTASLQELEPLVVPDETLRSWERPAARSGAPGTQDTSPDGRWFWLLAIGFLAVEEWLRRRAPRRPASTAMERPHERVA